MTCNQMKLSQPNENSLDLPAPTYHCARYERNETRATLQIPMNPRPLTMTNCAGRITAGARYGAIQVWSRRNCPSCRILHHREHYQFSLGRSDASLLHARLCRKDLLFVDVNQSSKKSSPPM